MFTNGGDQIDLSNTTFGVIDTVDYSDSSFPAVSEGISLALDPTGTAATNNDGANWCDDQVGAYGDGDLGSPGSVNAACPTSSPVSWATEVYPLFSTNSTQSCTGCHGSSGSLSLSGNASTVYSALVNSVADSGNTLVVPGSAATSHLYSKLSSGSMPQGSSSFNSTELATIEAWINEGAANN